MGSDIDLEAQQDTQTAPSAGTFFSSFSSHVDVLMVREEEEGGTGTRGMDILGPQTSSIASSPRSVHIAQDINDAQSFIAQAKGATFIWLCYLIYRRSICFVAGSGGNHINYSGTTRDRLTRAKEQSRAYFLIIAETWLA